MLIQTVEDKSDAPVHRQQHAVVSATILVRDVRKLVSICTERVHRRLGSDAGIKDLEAEVEAWFSRQVVVAAKVDRQELIAQLRAAEARGDQAGVAAALEALRNALAPVTKDGEKS